MLRPKSGIILILREYNCTMLQFSPNNPVHIRHANEPESLSDYLNQHPNLPLYVLLDPVYQSIEHFPLPPLKPWDRYLYLRQLLTNRQTANQLCGNLPVCKPYTTAGFVTCERTQALTAWLKLLEKTLHPIIGISFKCIEALHWLKRVIPTWNQNWHILICPEYSQGLTQLAFYQGQLWVVRQTSNHDAQEELQATLNYIRKLKHTSAQRISVHIMDQATAATSLSKILGPQTTCDYIDCPKYLESDIGNLPEQKFILDTAISTSLWHARGPNTHVKVTELASKKRLYTLPRYMLSMGSSLMILFLLGLGWMQQSQEIVTPTASSHVSISATCRKFNLSQITPMRQLKAIAPVLNSTGLIKIQWENTAGGSHIKLLMDVSDKNTLRNLKKIQKQLDQKVPEATLQLRPVKNLKLMDTQI